MANSRQTLTARSVNVGVVVSPMLLPTPLRTELRTTGGDATHMVWVIPLTAVGGAVLWVRRHRLASGF